MSDTRAFLRHALLISAGPLVWVAHFTVIYVWTALLCARGAEQPALIPAGIAAATVIAAGGLVLLGVAGLRAIQRDESRFLPVVSTALAALSLVGVLWNGLPAVLVSSCLR